MSQIFNWITLTKHAVASEHKVKLNLTPRIGGGGVPYKKDGGCSSYFLGVKKAVF